MIIDIASDNVLKQFSGELPDFVVITGTNGSGKTHLLRSFKGMNILSGISTLSENGIILNNINYFPLGDIRIIDIGASRTESLVSNWLLVYTEFITNLWKNKGQGIDSEDIPEIFKTLSETTGKSFEDITFNDYIKAAPIFDPSLGNLSSLFLNYYVRNSLKNINNDEDVNAPWVVLNDLLKQAHIKYTVDKPIEVDGKIDFYEMKILHNDKRLYFDWLSSGEQNIISLIVTLYQSQIGNSFPEVILFDESDSMFHPSFTKRYLDVLLKEFVGKRKVKIILTTHSPTTVALSPPDSIYVMEDGLLKKASKDEAIKSLTYGLKNLNVLYENKRQVMVEGDFDALFYEAIYPKIRLDSIANSEFVYFISCGKKEGGSSRVLEYTQKLFDAENKSICGIIDYDDNNKETDRVKVAGLNQRYSIENYVLDPLIMSFFLLNEENPSKKDLGYEDYDDIRKVPDFDENKLQKLTDIIVSKLKENLSDILKRRLNETLISVNLICGKVIKIPNWLFNYNNKILEKLYSDTFENLRRNGDVDTLKKEVLKKIIKLYPEFLPVDFVELFQRLENIEIN
ncbi:AAA family ATPase [Mucilaginibacter sp. NFX135]|uniref:AAA family ATPase n=1 Tax=Mucilaginibacter sp. NFX135 TaxID=3402687 RepID=UPI003AFAC3F1